LLLINCLQAEYRVKRDQLEEENKRTELELQPLRARLMQLDEQVSHQLSLLLLPLYCDHQCYVIVTDAIIGRPTCKGYLSCHCSSASCTCASVQEVLLLQSYGERPPQLQHLKLSKLAHSLCFCIHAILHQVKEQAMRTNSVKANMARNDERISQLMRMVIKA
jgi:hypothetical protein